ncbi:hypothetical protein GOODEAATRI_019139, partial [Goodea atripinnis]
HVAVSRTRSVSESESSFSLPSTFSAPTFLKSFYQGSLTDSGSFKRGQLVYCQAKGVSNDSDATELLPLSPRAPDPSLDPFRRLLSPASDQLPDKKPKKTGADYRALWKTAIHQQILLLRMEKENQRLEGECKSLLLYTSNSILSLEHILSWSHEGHMMLMMSSYLL